MTEIIENKNAKSLNYWLCKFVQEVANKSGERYRLRLKTVLGEENGVGALNPLAVSDERYHCILFFITRATFF